MNIIDIIIIIFLIYFGYSGLKKGFIRELSNMISYVFGFLLARIIFSMLSNNLNVLIIENRLRDKISYLIAFIMIVYIFKTLTRFIENLISIKWKNKLLGLTLGILNGLMIFALIISISKEIIPNTLSLHKNWNEHSLLYKNLNLLQKKYLIQYNENLN